MRQGRFQELTKRSRRQLIVDGERTMSRVLTVHARCAMRRQRDDPAGEATSLRDKTNERDKWRCDGNDDTLGAKGQQEPAKGQQQDKTDLGQFLADRPKVYVGIYQRRRGALAASQRDDRGEKKDIEMEVTTER
ncbi:hypothetical protein TREMEDRAFT_66482 [Tremella mesenterica DSM 1558]|uniref:uncharacterized protein n=1 Tax=Tremella mesenterica (strain ATCC 24925 / CBS 8224 / DSM 1558 / NBRC 9311 / NRRL Y-6157 / RJB 2259-6 / UBC 559-6) TaxID=578456 RepID=UPI00032C9A16|nr:uncharacterized protein TREMEDRAFT_66482 [Tremella mesenterica DSM 1558]EIW65491.1 hypothetical protein TREMEDRAFT_66482 [Tremella mesenterica DSM 1558]